MSTEKIGVYLSGPMYLGKEQAFKWRTDFTAVLRSFEKRSGFALGSVYKIFDPTIRYFEDKQLLEDKAGLIVKMDKMEIEASHVVIVNASNPGWGTPMEHYIAWAAGKLVLAVDEREYTSPWIKVHSHHVYKNFDDAAIGLIEMTPDILRTICPQRVV